MWFCIYLGSLIGVCLLARDDAKIHRVVDRALTVALFIFAGWALFGCGAPDAGAGAPDPAKVPEGASADGGQNGDTIGQVAGDTDKEPMREAEDSGAAPSAPMADAGARDATVSDGAVDPVELDSGPVGDCRGHEEGTPCDDGDPETWRDVCNVVGECTSTPIVQTRCEVGADCPDGYECEETLPDWSFCQRSTP